MLAGTNKEFNEYEKEELNIGESWCWLGLWVLMASQLVNEYREFFSLRQRTKDWKPSYLGDIMNRNRFEDIN